MDINENAGVFVPETGKFINIPEFAFVVKNVDDKKVMEKLRLNLEKVITIFIFLELYKP